MVNRAAQGVRWNRMLGGPAHRTPCTAATTTTRGRCFEAACVVPRRACNLCAGTPHRIGRFGLPRAWQFADSEPNGLAQRQRRSRCPLEPVSGGRSQLCGPDHQTTIARHSVSLRAHVLLDSLKDFHNPAPAIYPHPVARLQAQGGVPAADDSREAQFTCNDGCMR